MKSFGSQIQKSAALFLAVMVVVPAIAQDTGFADELTDFGVPATSNPRQKQLGYGAETPISIPGGKVVTTHDLIDMLAQEKKPVVIAAYQAQKTVPGGIVMDGAGEGRLLGPDKDKFANALSTFTSGDKSKPIVFYCHGSKCWLSYNAALHAIDLGYTNIYWYRGGRNAWKAAGQRFSAPTNSW